MKERVEILVSNIYFRQYVHWFLVRFKVYLFNIVLISINIFKSAVHKNIKTINKIYTKT